MFHRRFALYLAFTVIAMIFTFAAMGTAPPRAQQMPGGATVAGRQLAVATPAGHAALAAINLFAAESREATSSEKSSLRFELTAQLANQPTAPQAKNPPSTDPPSAQGKPPRRKRGGPRSLPDDERQATPVEGQSDLINVIAPKPKGRQPSK
jgi:hypothetical protein